MNRRHFLSATTFILASGAFRGASARAKPALGVQLFSIPKMLEKDFRAAIAFVAGLGYSEVEFYGPYSFSAPEAVAHWNSITPQLGFSGSGFFGLTARQVRAALRENQVSAPSMHTDLVTLQEEMGALAEAAHVLGSTYVVLPAIPQANRVTLDDYKRTAELFNRIGAKARSEGLKFAYHNHGYGLREMQGQIPLQIILHQTDPKLVFFEMDIYWTTAGGADPVQLLRENPGRYELLHLKDMKELRHFKGDGGDPSQWIELFPYMTTVGDGVIDIKGIIDQARKSDVKHLFVEQDMVADPAAALRRSADFLLALLKQ
jgi:sugar phosphate isomerase/epimerase